MGTSAIVAIIVALSLVTTAVSLSTVFRTVRDNRRELRRRQAVLASGTTARAVVGGIRQTGTTVGDQPEVLLNLTFAADGGEQISTEIRTVIPLVLIPQFQKGCVIEVKYRTDGGRLEVEPADAYLPSGYRSHE